MLALLIAICCVFGCPLIMGGMMWAIGRDWQGKRLDRELRRLERRAAAANTAGSRDGSDLRAAGLTASQSQTQQSR